MALIEHGKVHEGKIELAQPVALPEGTEVIVSIVAVGEAEAGGVEGGEFASLPFFGMWSDRPDMEGSSEWVRKEREQWKRGA